MSLPRYPQYKDSGVQWLGSVPNHWRLRRLGYFFSERREKVSDKEFPPLSVTKNGVVPQLETAAKSDDGDNRKLVRAGDFVINSRSDRKGSSGASELDGSVSLINTVLEPKGRIAIRFAHHLFRSSVFQEEYYRFGKGIVADLWSTHYSEMRNISLAVPDLQEQETIAGFLDHETAKIDALIAEQEKLLALLAEKRQATISHAVTRGLDPNVPMKASGITWLGDVPAHWEVGPLKRFWSVTDCKHLTAAFTEEGIPLASISEVQSRFVDLTGAKRTTESFFEQLIEGGRDPRSGDLIFSRNATVGEVAQVPGSIERFAMGQDVCLLRRRDDEASPDYMQAVLRSPVVAEQLNSLMIGSTFRRINVEQIRSLAVPYPPVAEQLEIWILLGTLLGRFDSLAQEAIAAVNLLKEHRSALIAAAVTGKIDVRGQVEAQAT